MGTLHAFLIALRTIIGMMEAVLIIRVVCDFTGVSRDSRPFRFLLFISEPLLHPVRKVLSAQAKEKRLKFDVSPLVVVIILQVISMVIKRYTF